MNFAKYFFFPFKAKVTFEMDSLIFIQFFFSSMMKTLLMHSKMQYINIGDPQGLVRCETYQSHLDLLGILVEDNYTDLPTLQELTKKDYVT